MNSSSFTAFLGIDWADEEHAVCELEDETTVRSVLPQAAGAIEDWVQGLRKRFGSRPIAICLEQSRGALLYALMKYEGLVLFPINPKQLAKYREAFAPSGAKNDPGDAELLARFVREHHPRLRSWRPDDAVTRKLRLLCEDRRHWVDERTAIGNRLLQTLKETYPLALEFLGKHVHAARFLALLTKYPTQRELQRAAPKQLSQWLSKLRRMVEDPPADPASDSRVVAIKRAVPLVTDEAVLLHGRLAVVHLVQQIKLLSATIAEYDREIATQLAQHPDAELFASFGGAGPALTPRLIAAFGADRQRYESALEVQQLSGAAPVQRQSGKVCVVKKRQACSKFLRQTFHEFARCSLSKCRWAKAYVAMLKSKGQTFHAAVRALAFKWIRILYRCWKNRVPYNDDLYLRQLRQKQSPLLAFLPPEKPLPQT